MTGVNWGRKDVFSCGFLFWVGWTLSWPYNEGYSPCSGAILAVLFIGT